MSRLRRLARSPLWAMLWKELVQLRRDRMTLGLMLGIPAIQLALFGYAIQTEVRHLPTVVLDESRSSESRRLVEVFANSGNFVETTPLLWKDAASPFRGFMQFSKWLYQDVRRTGEIALSRLTERLFTYLTKERGLVLKPTAECLARDYLRPGRRDLPVVLRPFVSMPEDKQQPGRAVTAAKRQRRHAIASN